MVTKNKRILALVLAVVLMCFNFRIVYASSDNAIEYDYPIRHGSPELEYADLKENAGPNVEAIETTVSIDTFREYLLECFAACPSYVDISKFKIPDTTENKEAIKSYIWYETPELFHVKGLGIGTSGGYIAYVYATYSYNAAQYSTKLNEFKTAADKLLVGIKGNTDLSDVEKALLLHDRIIVWCEYSTGSTTDDRYSAYGVFANKNAVCMGYAQAYDYLLTQVGIDNYYCSSDTLNHAWNIVYIDGEKYHVDVTWDDPLYDRSGRVRHTYFLRSTTGLYTARNKNEQIDYDSTPTSTKYDDYFWQSSNAEFQLVGDDIYYIDSTAETLNKISDGVTTTCRSLESIWMASSNSFWPSNYSTLSYDGKNLLYSQPKGVYKYDVLTGSSEIIYTPDFSAGEYYSIYGFKYEECQLICEVYNTPNFEATTKAENTQTKEHHVSSYWTTEASGIRCRKCINCDHVFEYDFSSAQVAVPVGDTVIDNENALIFTNTLCCDNINDLITVNSAFSFNVTESSAALCGTGTVIEFTYQGIEVCSYILIVNGDLNGDSVCDVLDASQTERYSTEKGTPTQNEIFAANATVSDTIDAQSYQNVVNIALAA